MKIDWKTGLKMRAGRVLVRIGLARFRRDDRGVTAIEFALVALPFAAMMFAIIETGIVFFAGQTMETAISKSARLIRTGQAQQQTLTKAQFLDDICGVLGTLFDCKNKLMLDVRTFKSFGDVDTSTPLDGKGNVDSKNFTYEPGAGGDIVIVRAYYEWPVFVNLLGFSLANTPGGGHLLGATAAFRNEPFAW